MVDLMLCSYHRNVTMLIIQIKRVGGNFRGDEHAYGIDCGNGFTTVHLSPNSSTCIH